MSRRTNMAPPLRSRRPRRKQPNSTSTSTSTSCHHLNKDEEEENGQDRFEEGAWRFQAELLRDECSFLRTEREFALKKLEKNRVKMERTLQSAVHTLVSGKNKISEGKNDNAVLEEEIEDLAEKLDELQMNLRTNTSRNLDKENSVSDYRSKNKSIGVDTLRRKMEGFSNVMFDRVEEDCGPLLSSRANGSVPGSASTSKRLDRFIEPSTLSTRQSYQEPVSLEENKCSGRCKAIISRIVEQVRVENEQWSQMQLMLGRVRGEMDEMQESRDFWENRALDLDCEIQSLRRAVKEWRKKALGFENKANELQVELSSLKGALQKSKTGLNSDKSKNVSLDKNKNVISCPVSLRKQLEKEKLESSSRLEEDYCIEDKVRKCENADEELNKDESINAVLTKNLPAISLGKQLAKEKLRRLKEIRRAIKGSKEELFGNGRKKPQECDTGVVDPKRSPLKDIENSNAYSSFNL